METTKIVLLFNDDDERQAAAAEFLKTQKRCKTAFVTGLVCEWLKNRDRGEQAGRDQDADLPEKVKAALLSDRSFIRQVASLLDGGQPAPAGDTLQIPEEEYQAGSSDLDMDEDLLLAGLAMFETQTDL